MKKGLGVVTLLLLSAIAFAADITDLNGFDWIGWNDTQRVSFVVGFISANNMMIEYLNFQNKYGLSFPEKQIEDQFGYTINVANVCAKIDEYYEIYDNRTFLIWHIIL